MSEVERTWTDDRDGKVWRVYNFGSPVAQGVSPTHDPTAAVGEKEIQTIIFRHPPAPASTREGYSAPNPHERPVDDLDDAELRTMLDAAIERAARGT